MNSFATGVLVGVAASASALIVGARKRRQRFVAAGEQLSSECPQCGATFRYGHPSQKLLAFDLHLLTKGCWQPETA